MMPAPGLRTFRIVLLEDNDADIYLLRRALKMAGLHIELTVLKDGAEGLAFARRQGEPTSSPLPDLVVLDLNLPKGGGASVLRALRQNAVLARTPVVVMSSSATPSEQAVISELGVARYLTKPPDLAAFMKLGQVFGEVLREGIPPR